MKMACRWDGTPGKSSCGRSAHWDGCGFRCDTCMHISGSISDPCKDDKPLDIDTKSEVVYEQ